MFKCLEMRIENAGTQPWQEIGLSPFCDIDYLNMNSIKMHI